MATITRNGTNLVRPNFANNELYTKCPAGPASHPLSDITLDGLQIIRDWSGAPMRVTSSWRSTACNFASGGSQNSEHLSGSAIDFQWTSNNENRIKQFREEMKCQGQLYQQLRAAGVNGFGFYDTFLHIDDRSNFTAWDYSTKFDGYTMSTNFFNAPPQECVSCDAAARDCCDDVPDGCGGDMNIGKKWKSWFENFVDAWFTPGVEDGFAANKRGIILLSVSVLLIVGGLIVYTKMKK